MNCFCYCTVQVMFERQLQQKYLTSWKILSPSAPQDWTQELLLLTSMGSLALIVQTQFLWYFARPRSCGWTSGPRLPFNLLPLQDDSSITTREEQVHNRKTFLSEFQQNCKSCEEVRLCRTQIIATWQRGKTFDFWLQHRGSAVNMKSAQAFRLSNFQVVLWVKAAAEVQKD